MSYGRFKRKNERRCVWTGPSPRRGNFIEEGKKARAEGGQFSAYFLLPYHTRALFILFLKYQQGPLREKEA